MICGAGAGWLGRDGLFDMELEQAPTNETIADVNTANNINDCIFVLRSPIENNYVRAFEVTAQF